MYVCVCDFVIMYVFYVCMSVYVYVYMCVYAWRPVGMLMTMYVMYLCVYVRMLVRE